MKVLLTSVFVFTLLAAPTFAQAQTKSIDSAIAEMTAKKSGKINRLMDLSGIRQQYGEIPKVIKSAADAPSQPGQEIPQFLRDGIRVAVDKTISAEELVNAVIKAVDENLSEEEIDVLLDWYEKDMAQKIASAETAASTPESIQGMEQNIGTLMTNEERKTIARKVDELTGSSDFAVEIQMFTQLAMVSAVANVMGPDAGINVDFIKAQLEQSRGALQEQIRQASIATFVYTYRDIADIELDEYVSFLETDESRKFISHMMTATKSSMQKMITAFTQEFAQFMKNANQ